MYRLDVTKGPLSGYAISVSKQGSCVEDHIIMDDDNTERLLVECSSVVSSGEIAPTLTRDRVCLDKHSNSYQMIVNVSEGYVRVYCLTMTEIKLLRASLKRAVDG